MNTNKNKIVWVVIPILFVIIFVVALILIYSKKGTEQSGQQSMTEKQKLMDSMTAKGPSTISAEERAALQVSMSGSDKSSLTPDERKKLMESMSAQ